MRVVGRFFASCVRCSRGETLLRDTRAVSRIRRSQFARSVQSRVAMRLRSWVPNPYPLGFRKFSGNLLQPRFRQLTTPPHPSRRELSSFVISLLFLDLKMQIYRVFSLLGTFETKVQKVFSIKPDFRQTATTRLLCARGVTISSSSSRP